MPVQGSIPTKPAPLQLPSHTAQCKFLCASMLSYTGMVASVVINIFLRPSHSTQRADSHRQCHTQKTCGRAFHVFHEVFPHQRWHHESHFVFNQPVLLLSCFPQDVAVKPRELPGWKLENKGTLRSEANGMLQAVMCKGSRNENPSHRGENMDCEILEVAARLLKDTASAEYVGYTSENVTHGAAQWPSTLHGHANQAPPDHCGFWDSWGWYLLSGYEDYFCLCSFFFFLIW